MLTFAIGGCLLAHRNQFDQWMTNHFLLREANLCYHGTIQKLPRGIHQTIVRSIKIRSMNLFNITGDDNFSICADTLDQSICLCNILILEFVINGQFIREIPPTRILDRYARKPVVPDQIYAIFELGFDRNLLWGGSSSPFLGLFVAPNFLNSLSPFFSFGSSSKR